MKIICVRAWFQCKKEALIRPLVMFIVISQQVLQMLLVLFIIYSETVQISARCLFRPIINIAPVQSDRHRQFPGLICGSYDLMTQFVSPSALRIQVHFLETSQTGPKSRMYPTTRRRNLQEVYGNTLYFISPPFYAVFLLLLTVSSCSI